MVLLLLGFCGAKVSFTSVLHKEFTLLHLYIHIQRKQTVFAFGFGTNNASNQITGLLIDEI